MEPAAARDLSAVLAFEDGLGRRYRFVDPKGNEAPEMLCFRAELAAIAGFESSLRDRASRVANFQHPNFARIRSVGRLQDQGSTLALVSEYPAGVRLSEVLAAVGLRGLALDLNAALCVVRQLLSAVAVLHQSPRNLANGALAPERIVITPEGRLVIVEFVLGPALEQLRFSHERYWKELRIPVPPSAGLPRFDYRADVTQAGVVALSLLLGRQIAEDEYPSHMEDAVASVFSGSTHRDRARLKTALRSWLMRALQLEVRSSFPTMLDAQSVFDEILSEDADYRTAAVSLEAVLSNLHECLDETTDLSTVVHPAASTSLVSDLVAPLVVEPIRLPTIESPSEAELPRSTTGTWASIPPEAIRASTRFEMPDAKASRSPIFLPDPIPDPLGAMPIPQTPAARPTRTAQSLAEFVSVEAVASRVEASPPPASSRPALRVGSEGGSRVGMESVVRPFQRAEPTPRHSEDLDDEPIRIEPVAEPVRMEKRESEQAFTVAPHAASGPLNAASAWHATSAESEELPMQTQRPRRNWRGLAAAGILLVLVTGGGIFAARRYAAPSAAVTTTGSLMVNTNPPGAQVSIDGEARGLSPLNLTLAPGAHVLEVRGAGEPRTIPITITTGSQVSQYIELPGGTAVHGQLQVRSEPSGARVTVDGVQRGTAPLMIEDLVPGEHAVVLESELGSVKQTVTIEAGTTASLVVPLTPSENAPLSGWLSISAPVNMQLFEKGRLVGSSDIDRIMMPTGRHEIEIVNEVLGYRDTRTVQVGAGRVTPISIDMPNATISINAVPWANVSVDGQQVGETPIGNLSLPIGPHEVIFRHPEFGEQRRAVTVTLTAPARLSVDMRKP